MKFIDKGNSPTDFEQWKVSKNPSSWSDFDSNLPPVCEDGVIYYSKNELRNELLNEQGSLCCYCMSNIKNDHNTTIEHFISRDANPELTFEYGNILAACNGGRKSDNSPAERWCDANKGNNNSTIISPLNPNCEIEFKFKVNGEIESDTDIGKNTIAVLNLNARYIKEKREKAINVSLFKEDGTLISTEDMLSLATELRMRSKEHKFKEYCTAIINVLNQYGALA